MAGAPPGTSSSRRAGVVTVEGAWTIRRGPRRARSSVAGQRCRRRRPRVRPRSGAAALDPPNCHAQAVADPPTAGVDDDRRGALERLPVEPALTRHDEGAVEPADRQPAGIEALDRSAV